MFFKEEIIPFQLAYFENICNLLDTEKSMRHFCRDVFLRTKGIVPDLDKDALGYITLDLEHRYMFDTKYKFDRWGFVQIPRGLIDEYAGHILTKVVVCRRTKVEEEARRQAERADALRKVTPEAAREAERADALWKVTAEAEEARRLAEAAGKAEDGARRLAEALLIADACVRLREETAAGVAASTKKIPLPQMKACFSSLAELLDDMHAKGGRDLFIADLAKNHDSANYANYHNHYGGYLRHNLSRRLESIRRTDDRF